MTLLPNDRTPCAHGSDKNSRDISPVSPTFCISANDQGNFGKQGITRENLRDDEERNLIEKLLSLVLDESSRPTKDLQTDLYVNFRDYSSRSLSSCLHHEFLLISSLIPAPLVCAFVFVILAG